MTLSNLPENLVSLLKEQASKRASTTKKANSANDETISNCSNRLRELGERQKKVGERATITMFRAVNTGISRALR